MRIVGCRSYFESPHFSTEARARRESKRPAETARAIMFQLLEDETGQLNVVVSAEQQERQRDLYRPANLVVVRGVLERRTAKPNLIASGVWSVADLVPDKSGNGARLRTMLRAATPRSRDYR